MVFDSKIRNKVLLILFIAVLVGIFFALDLQKYLTLEFIKGSRESFHELYIRQPVFVIACFVSFYIPAIALNLPGATLLALMAGALFGAFTGTLVISFASTIGATLACLLSRYLLRDWVQKKFGERLERINEGIRREGAFYLFSMRLIPVIPFFIINLVMGLTPIRLSTFYWVSQLGMLPGTFIYVNAGSQIARIDSPAGIFSPGLIGSLVLLGIFPLITKKLIDFFRKRWGGEVPDETAADSDCSDALSRTAEKILTSCTNCGACKPQCAFLTEYGTPKEILSALDGRLADLHKKAFECSLCNLCSAVCPENVDPGSLFFLARKDAVDRERADLSRYKTLLSYERKGNSPLFSWYGLPRGCDTVFFPGCTLPGTRPETTWKLFRHLQKAHPSLGIVLDCCNKISHDLGRLDYFDSMFTEMKNFLQGNAIKMVWVACPNCYKVFKSYGHGLEVKTVYEIMELKGLPSDAVGSGEFSVHDPCPLRQESGVQDVVRSLVSRIGLTESKMRHSRSRTLCCGEGGSVGCLRPEFANAWGQKRQKTAQGRTLITYCAGCAGFLNRKTPTLHLADLIFDTQQSLNGGPRVARAPFTYLHRLRLKHRFKKCLAPAVQRIRPHDPSVQASQRKNECTIDDCRRTLYRKGLILTAAFILSIGIFVLANHLMYILDSYIYLAEFHTIFIRENLAGNGIAKFADYFKALGPLYSIFSLVTGAFFELATGFWPPPVLHAGINKAYGAGLGGVISLTAFCVAGVIFFGLGRFFLGEILPMIRKTKAALSGPVVPVLTAMLVIPHIPVAVPAVLGGLSRMRFKSIVLILTAGLLVRVFILSFLT